MWGLCVVFLIGCIACQLSLNRLIEQGGALAAEEDYRHRHLFRRVSSGGGGGGSGGGKGGALGLERSVSPHRAHEIALGVLGGNAAASAPLIEEGGVSGFGQEGKSAAVMIGGAVAGPTAVHGRVGAQRGGP